MKAKPTKNPKNVVPKQVFDRFFEALEEKGIATNVIKRLKDTIIGQNKVSEVAIRIAFFDDNDTEV